MPLLPAHETKLSKLLAYLLRHRPDSIGLKLDEHAWVALEALVDGVNSHQRLPFTIVRDDVVSLIEGPGSALFELNAEGRVRARSGHSVEGVEVERVDVPEFLFLSLDPDDFDVCCGAQSLERPDGAAFRLAEDEEAVNEDDLVVIEAARATRNGCEFTALEEPGVYTCARIPLRYVISKRSGYVRQISAGGVLVRHQEGEIQFALIRTLPRDQAVEEGKQAAAAAAESGGGERPEPPAAKAPPEPPAKQKVDRDDSATWAVAPDEAQGDVAEGRADDERRRGEDRRREEGGGDAPGGVERRRGRSRRLRRRRRSGRWSAEGRLELPKGKLEAGETPPQAAIREACEEMGLTVGLTVRASLSKNHYTFRTPSGRTVFKTVYYFLLECAEADPSFTPRREEGIVSVEWWASERAIAQVAFPSLKPVLERAWELSRTG